MDPAFQFPVNIVLYSIGLCFCHQSHPQLGVVFALAPSHHYFWSYFSTLLQQHIGHLLSCEFLFQCPVFLPFHTVHGVLKAGVLKRFAIAFSSGPRFIRTLHHDPSLLGGSVWLGSWFHSFSITPSMSMVPRHQIPWRRAWQPTLVFLPEESPWTEEPGGPWSMESQRVTHNWATKHTVNF